MINWSHVQTSLYGAFITNMPSSIEESANIHAGIFVNDVLLKATLSTGNKCSFRNTKTVIEDISIMFQTLFNTNIKSIVDLHSVPYIVLATSLSGYIYTNMNITTLPPIPPTTTPQPIAKPIIMTTAGNPLVFGKLLYEAFTSGKKANTTEEGGNIVSKSLSLAYKTYLSTITGQYFGLVPNPNGAIPTTITWVGLV